MVNNTIDSEWKRMLRLASTLEQTGSPVDLFNSDLVAAAIARKIVQYVDEQKLTIQQTQDALLFLKSSSPSRD
ncbi:hypothetical protein KKD03_05440 [Patescibacteria group bacterium]|nr:hypothetical protein [Patescibacteria group bacterium]